MFKQVGREVMTGVKHLENVCKGDGKLINHATEHRLAFVILLYIKSAVGDGIMNEWLLLFMGGAIRGNKGRVESQETL